MELHHSLMVGVSFNSKLVRLRSFNSKLVRLEEGERRFKRVRICAVSIPNWIPMSEWL